jgi:hyaluronan synthase
MDQRLNKNTPAELDIVPSLDVASREGRPSRADLVWKLSIVLSLAVIFIGSLAFGAFPRPEMFVEPVRHLTFVSVVGLTSLGLGVLYGAITLYYAFRYRPVATPTDAELPTLTVIVPAYNEGPMVRVSLMSALRSDYPADKLQIIAVDDGSKDDTWLHIEAVAKASGGRVTAVKMEKNGGKREALRQGFLRATGEMVVTVDSDSELDPKALREIVAPLVADKEVAVVAGKVLVLNRYESLLTRLMAARFFITFDFVRAAQSKFGAVLCCPGALSAYRRSAVMAVLEPWSEQTFLGSACTIGEDRALTTWLIRNGWRAVYQGSAIVHTMVPTHIKGVAKMLLRWERGNVRENLVLLPVFFGFKGEWRTRHRAWPMFDVMFDLLSYPLGYILIGAFLKSLVTHPMLLIQFAASLGVMALLQSLLCLRSEKSTDFVYNIGYAFLAVVGFQWIFPYSCFTLRDGRWMTR